MLLSDLIAYRCRALLAAILCGRNVRREWMLLRWSWRGERAARRIARRA